MTRQKRAAGGTPKPCCMVSEILEEAGVDRARARQIRKQVLEGIILMCRWQLERMERPREEPRPPRRGRKVEVE